MTYKIGDYTTDGQTVGEENIHMANTEFIVRYKRSEPGDHGDYGKSFERAVEKLTDPNGRTTRSSGYPRTVLLGRAGYLERHEDGPELLITIIEQLPNYITAMAALITIWMNRPKKPKEKTRIEISGKGFEHSVDIDNPEDADLARKLLRHYGKQANIKRASYSKKKNST